MLKQAGTGYFSRDIRVGMRDQTLLGIILGGIGRMTVRRESVFPPPCGDYAGRLVIDRDGVLYYIRKNR